MLKERMGKIKLTKKCTTCFIEKPIEGFYSAKLGRFGVRAVCKVCEKKYRDSRKESSKDYFKDYYVKNKEKRQVYEKKRRSKYKDKLNADSNKYYIENKEVIKKAQKIYRDKHKEKTKSYNKVYRIANKKKRGDYLTQKRKIDPKFRLNLNIRNAIRVSLKGNKNGRHWEGLVGYTLDHLKAHLEKLFKKGMGWENYGEWHIDHSIPISAHNFSHPEHEDFKRCWALENLQPMWAKENISKGAKLNKPFQPMLKMKMK